MTQIVRVQYDGGEAEHGRMSAADLGGAMMGMADMVSGASGILIGDDAHVRARVRTDFGGNSFLVVFEIVSRTADLLSSAESVVSLLGLSENSNGLIQTLQWIRGRRITAVRRRQADDPGASMTIHIGEDARELTVSDVRALRDEKTVRGIVGVMKPLVEGNATKVTIGSGDGTAVPTGSDLAIEQEEAAYLQEPTFPDDEVVTKNVRDDSHHGCFAHATLMVEKGNQWRHRRESSCCGGGGLSPRVITAGLDFGRPGSSGQKTGSPDPQDEAPRRRSARFSGFDPPIGPAYPGCGHTDATPSPSARWPWKDLVRYGPLPPLPPGRWIRNPPAHQDL